MAFLKKVMWMTVSVVFFILFILMLGSAGTVMVGAPPIDPRTRFLGIIVSFGFLAISIKIFIRSLKISKQENRKIM